MTINAHLDRGSATANLSLKRLDGVISCPPRKGLVATRGARIFVERVGHNGEDDEASRRERNAHQQGGQAFAHPKPTAAAPN